MNRIRAHIAYPPVTAREPERCQANNVWTEDEDRILRTHWLRKPPGVIATMLPGRSKGAVTSHAKALGLTPRRLKAA